jgi:hypothetical protein
VTPPVDDGLVGGIANLQSLDVAPLPTEPFDWSAVEVRDRDGLEEILRIVEVFTDRFQQLDIPDVQYRTIINRLSWVGAFVARSAFPRSSLWMRLASPPMRFNHDGRLQMRGRRAVPRWALRAPDESGRAVVLVTFGEHERDLEVIGFSVPGRCRAFWSVIVVPAVTLTRRRRSVILSTN